MPEPKRSRRCLVTFTDKEIDQLALLAKAKGLKIATLIRSLVITSYFNKARASAPAH